jgi:hypothetical protein
MGLTGRVKLFNFDRKWVLRKMGLFVMEWIGNEIKRKGLLKRLVLKTNKK